jgi:hypothetical protein
MYKKEKIDLPLPKDQRKGQAIFNFLEWLITKDYPIGQGLRMADPFHIADEEFDKLWNEFIKQ